MSRLHATDPPGQAWAISYLCLVSMQLTHRAKLGPWAVYVSSPCNWPTGPSLGHELFMSRLHATDPPGQAWAISYLCLVSSSGQTDNQIIIIITICKAPTLRLKSLKKHSITHIMFIEMETLSAIKMYIRKKKKLTHNVDKSLKALNASQSNTKELNGIRTWGPPAPSLGVTIEPCRLRCEVLVFKVAAADSNFDHGYARRLHENLRCPRNRSPKNNKQLQQLQPRQTSSFITSAL